MIKTSTTGIDRMVIVILRTMNDAKVDDKICLPLANLEWDIESPNRPSIPLHLNCRCHWENKETGEHMGQF